MTRIPYAHGKVCPSLRAIVVTAGMVFYDYIILKVNHFYSNISEGPFSYLYAVGEMRGEEVIANLAYCKYYNTSVLVHVSLEPRGAANAKLAHQLSRYINGKARVRGNVKVVDKAIEKI